MSISKLVSSIKSNRLIAIDPSSNSLAWCVVDLDINKFDIWRSYKKLHFTKKKGWFKNKEIDISIDEDIFLFMISDYFNLDIPFREIED